MSLIFLDVEATKEGIPALGKMTEFGAVEYKTGKEFHGILWEARPSKENPAIPEITGKHFDEHKIALEFEKWLKQFDGRPIFVSDNNGYDFMWMADFLVRNLGYNPFGHSSRRISDFYAGLMGDFYCAQKWKRLRMTKHSHKSNEDARGNVEAFRRLLNGERP